jgi:predicted aspartyl protease
MSVVDLSWPPGHLQSDGPWILISIGNPQFELDEARALGLEFPEPRPFKALIDTGASVTIINPEVAQTWKLRQTGFAQIAAAGSSGRYPEHAAAIRFPGTDLKGFDPIRVIACPIVRQPVSCLIGRDILRSWLLTYNGQTGQVTVQD